MTRTSPPDARALEQVRKRVVKAPDQRRRELLAAAVDLFHRRGFEATTVQAIAAAAGAAAGTVYLYFPSKDALLDAIQEDFEAGLLERFSQVAEEVLAEEDVSGEVVAYEDVVHRLIDGLVGFCLEHRARCEVVMRRAGSNGLPDNLATSGLTDLLARVIREGVRLGYVDVSDPETAAYLLNLAAVGAIGHAIAFGPDEALDRVVRATKELYVKALAPRPGT